MTGSTQSVLDCGWYIPSSNFQINPSYKDLCMNDSTELVVYWQKNSFQYDLSGYFTAIWLSRDLQIAVYIGCSIGSNEERRDCAVVVTLHVLTVTCMSFSLKFRFQVNSECQFTMWISVHHSFSPGIHLPRGPHKNIFPVSTFHFVPQRSIEKVSVSQLQSNVSQKQSTKSSAEL